MIRISDIRVPPELFGTWEKIAAAKLKVPQSEIKSALPVRVSVDARKFRGAAAGYCCTIDAEVVGEKRILAKFSRDGKISPAPPGPVSIFETLSDYSGKTNFRPVIVGFGPAGIFASLFLAKAGLSPIALERGENIENRAATVGKFWSGGALSEESNAAFGEGGAGAFSDGKLTTRGKNPLMKDVKDAFVRAGAPEEIRYLAKPHIGTDRLRGAVKRLREEIISLGGEVKFGAKLTDIETKDGIISVQVNGGERINTDALFLGIGHSARDTYGMLFRRGVFIEPKAFAVGVRIEHPQEFINRAQYGNAADILPAADYAFTFRDAETGRGVYSFCMCPGGEVVSAASEADGVVTNGMSLYSRASGTANAAIVAEVRTEDFGGGALGGIEFQRKYEKLAFRIAGGDHRAPVSSVSDFLNGKSGGRCFLTNPTYRPGVSPSDLRECLPPFVYRAIANALPEFDSRIKDFAAPGVPLTGVETRTSSPCRIVRMANGESVSTPGLFPIGEGAGYAGGIMSAAVDGIRAALAFLGKIGHNGGGCFSNESEGA